MTDTVTNLPVTTSLEVVPFTPSVRTIARQQNIDLAGLISILELRRPDKSATEKDFVDDLASKLDGSQFDTFGNLYLTIGEKPNVMWSCHTDTVSKEGGRQNLKWNGDILSLNQGKPGQSLGADDGAGLWLLLEMIKAKKEGLYVFHRAEEVGRLGSKWISKNAAHLLDTIDIAIAFDRRGTDSIITHQSGRRTCSDAFAEKLGAAFGPAFKKDPTGSYTDTYSYVDQISECTNVSVGYVKEHGPTETLDVAHLFKLRDALLALDTSTLPVERDASKTEWEDDRWGGYGSYAGFGSYGGYSSGTKSKWRQDQDDLDEMMTMIKNNPRSIAIWLQDARYTPDILCALVGNHLRPVKAKPKSAEASASVFEKESGSKTAAPFRDAVADADLANEDEPELFYEPGIYCHDCEQGFESRYQEPQDGDECDQCLGRNTTICEVTIDGDSGEVVEAVEG